MGMVLMGDGRAEQRHHPIPQELIDRPFVPVHRVQDHLEGPVRDGVDFLRVEALGHRP